MSYIRDKPGLPCESSCSTSYSSGFTTCVSQTQQLYVSIAKGKLKEQLRMYFASTLRYFQVQQTGEVDLLKWQALAEFRLLEYTLKLKKLKRTMMSFSVKFRGSNHKLAKVSLMSYLSMNNCYFSKLNHFQPSQCNTS